MIETWFEFTAYNSQAHYGFGTEAEADLYSDILNRKREIGQYHYRVLSTKESKGLDSGDDTDGFRLDDALVTQAGVDEWQAEQEPRLYRRV